ncbi:MAG: CoA-binding protein, partial [Nitrospirae bacterium]|nr:CoA-binding protein [Nitrospirota bacterium]
MSIRNLDKIFNPRVVAFVGASAKTETVGGSVLRNLIGSGFERVVYPVHPKRESVQ